MSALYQSLIYKFQHTFFRGRSYVGMRPSFSLSALFVFELTLSAADFAFGPYKPTCLLSSSCAYFSAAGPNFGFEKLTFSLPGLPT